MYQIFFPVTMKLKLFISYIFFLLITGIILTALGIGCSTDSGISLESIPENNNPAGEILEFSFNVNRPVQNPYDVESINVTMNVWLQQGDTLKIPAFYYLPYKEENNGQSWVQTGGSTWKVRFTPREQGTYYYNLEVVYEDEVVKTGTKNIQVAANSHYGFIETRENSRYFHDAAGNSFFPSGINLAHPPHNGQPLDYDYFFEKMAQNGMNFTRIWLTPQWGKHAIALEWTDGQYPTQKGNLGLRRINAEMAYRLDQIMDSALKNGVYVMLCLLDERELEAEKDWKTNPYNSKNGGPANEPMDFFSNAEAKNAFKNRLHYLIARWSAYPNLFAWEFWNEFDHHRLIPDWESQRESVGAWHHEMSRYVKATDPHQHMVTTSVVGSRTDRLIWDYPEIDFVQAHSYVGKDHLAERTDDLYQLFSKEYPDKPFLISEMGTDWRGFNSQYDAERVGLHNGLWGSTMGGNSGTAMWWWWLEMDDADMWKEWKDLTAFTDGIRWNENNNDSIITDNPDLKGKYLISDGTAWVWCYNRLHNWKNTKNAIPVKPLNAVTVMLEKIPPGKYKILWFNKGRFNQGQIVHSHGALELHLPELKSDVAFKLVPVD